MTIKRAIGWFLLSLPFLGLGMIIGWAHGPVAVLGIYAAVVALVGVIFAGTHLILSDT